MAPKRNQAEAFNIRSSVTRPTSTADSLFSSPALVRAASRAQGSSSPARPETINPSQIWQHGSQVDLTPTNEGFDYGSPFGAGTDAGYTDYSTYSSSAAGDDYNDFNDMLALQPVSRAPSENPSGMHSQMYLPSNTVAPNDTLRSPPTSTPAHLLSPAITNSPSPRILPTGVQNQPLVHTSGQAQVARGIPTAQARPSKFGHGAGLGSSANAFPGLENDPKRLLTPMTDRSTSQAPQSRAKDNDKSDLNNIIASSTNNELDSAPTRVGIDPSARAPLNDEDIPTLEDQSKQRVVDATKADVEKWLSGTTTKAPTQAAASSRLTHHPSERGTDLGSQAPKRDSNLVEETEDDHDDTDDEDDWAKRTSVADDSPPTPRASHDHVLQTMAEATSGNGDPAALAAGFRTMRLWSDNPGDDDSASVKQAPESSTRAIERFARRARDVETVSMAATYASSRRQSQADTNSLYSASGISQRQSTFVTDAIAIPEELEPDPAPRKDSLLNKLQRSISKQSSRRRKESQETEKRPSLDNHGKSDSQGSIPSITKTPSWGQQTKHVPLDSSTRPVLGVNTTPTLGLSQKKGWLRRPRSRSDISQNGERRNSALAQQWAASGGPPVAFVRPTYLDTPSFNNEPFPPMADEHQQGIAPASLRLQTQDTRENSHEVDDDDEEASTPTGAGPRNTLPIPATATLEGFRDHARKISPRLQSFLVERIAQEQVKRYRTLVDVRIEHHQHVINNTCESGQRCADLGTGPKYLRPQKSRADKDEKSAVFQISSETPAHEIEHLNIDESPQLATFPEGIPSPPVKQLPAEFECPICFKVKRLQKPSDWSKHCFEDLYPFICSFADCAEPKSFNRKADWSRHESERHLKLETWTCCFEDCSHVCHRRDNFIQHLVRAHKMQEPKGQGPRRRTGEDDSDVTKLAKDCHLDTPKRPEDQKCPFCNNFCNTWKKLAVHLANHMKQINLPLLALIEQENISQYIAPVDGTGVDTAALMQWRRQASLAQNYPVPVGTPSFAGSVSPQPPHQPAPMNGMSSGVLYDADGQAMVHPALQGSHTFPGTKNLPRDPSPFGGSMYSTQPWINESNQQVFDNTPQLGIDYDNQPSNYLDSIQEARSAQRTPTPATYPPPFGTTPGQVNFDSNHGQLYPTTSAYDSNAMYTTSPTYDGTGINGGNAHFNQIPTNGYYGSNNDTTNDISNMGYMNMNNMNDSTNMSSIGHDYNMSNPTLVRSTSRVSGSTHTSNMSDHAQGFMPAQSQAARNAQLNAQLRSQESAASQYRNNRTNQHTVYYDAPEYDQDEYLPIDHTTSAPQLSNSVMGYQQQTMPGQQQYQGQPHDYQNYGQ